MGRTIGIDLGTSASSVAVMADGGPHVVLNQEGERQTPSVVSRSADGTWLVGSPAKANALNDPENTIWDFVRLFGRPFDAPETRIASSFAPYSIVGGPEKEARFRLRESEVHPAMLAALVLSKLKAAAENHLGDTVERAVITVPTVFHTLQCAIVCQAARLSGLDSVSILPSPTAAALAYGSKRVAGRVALCDLGGGSFSVSILELSEGEYRVLAYGWERFIGGEDFDQLILRWLVDEHHRETGRDLTADPFALARLKRDAERAKCELTSSDRVRLETIESPLERAWFEQMLGPQLEWLLPACVQTLRGAGLTRQDIDHVIPVGGSARIPLVLATLDKIFRKTPVLGINPQEAAAVGAAVYAGILDGDVTDLSFADVTRASVGIEYPEGVLAPIVDRNESLPAKKSRIFTMSGSGFELRLLEGSTEPGARNAVLGKLSWDMPFRRGGSHVEVEVDLRAMGELTVSALDTTTGATKPIPVEPFGGIAEEEIGPSSREVERFVEGLLSEKLNGGGASSPRFADLTTPEKILAATKGDRKTRLALIRDRTRAVWSAVLSSPKLEEADAEEIAAMRDVAPEVLSAIGSERKWTARYPVALSLVFNPATPPETSLRLVDRLEPRDLERASHEVGLPPVVRNQARVLIRMRS